MALFQRRIVQTRLLRVERIDGLFLRYQRLLDGDRTVFVGRLLR